MVDVVVGFVVAIVFYVVVFFIAAVVSVLVVVVVFVAAVVDVIVVFVFADFEFSCCLGGASPKHKPLNAHFSTRFSLKGREFPLIFFRSRALIRCRRGCCY